MENQKLGGVTYTAEFFAYKTLGGELFLYFKERHQEKTEVCAHEKTDGESCPKHSLPPLKMTFV